MRLIFIAVFFNLAILSRADEFDKAESTETPRTLETPSTREKSSNPLQRMTIFDMITLGMIVTSGIFSALIHLYGRHLNGKVKDSCVLALLPFLKNHFSVTFDPKAAPTPGPSDNFFSFSLDRYQAWHSGRVNVKGMYTTLDTANRTSPLFWLPSKDAAPKGDQDTLTLDLPFSSNSGPHFFLALLAEDIPISRLDRKDFEIYGTALPNAVGLPASMKAFGDHGDCLGFLLKNSNALKEAIEKASPSLISLVLSDAPGLLSDSAGDLGKAAAISGSRVLSVQLRCPKPNSSSRMWKDTVIPWCEAALELADVLSAPSLKVSMAISLTVTQKRVDYQGKQAKLMAEEMRLKKAMEKKEALSKLSQGKFEREPAAFFRKLLLYNVFSPSRYHSPPVPSSQRNKTRRTLRT